MVSYIVKRPTLVYKKARGEDGREAIITLRLPRGTLTAFPVLERGKNRASKAVVVSIITKDPRPIAPLCHKSKACAICDDRRREIANWEKRKNGTAKVARSDYNRSFLYRVGRTVRPTREFNTSDTQCSTGIHFYRHRAAALRHSL